MDLLSDSTGNDMVMMTIKNFDFLDNEIEEYEVGNNPDNQCIGRQNPISLKG